MPASDGVLKTIEYLVRERDYWKEQSNLLKERNQQLEEQLEKQKQKTLQRIESGYYEK